MNPKELNQLGVPRGNPMGEVFKFIQTLREQRGDSGQLKAEISAVLLHPSRFVDDPVRAGFA